MRTKCAKHRTLGTEPNTSTRRSIRAHIMCIRTTRMTPSFDRRIMSQRTKAYFSSLPRGMSLAPAIPERSRITYLNNGVSTDPFLHKVYVCTTPGISYKPKYFSKYINSPIAPFFLSTAIIMGFLSIRHSHNRSPWSIISHGSRGR